MAPTIYPSDRDDAAVLARRLLDAAGPARRGEVRTVTDGPAGIAFDVPDDVYAALTGDGDGPAAADGAGPGVVHDAPAGDGARPATATDVDEPSGAGEAPAGQSPADTTGAAGAGRGRRRAPR